MTLAEKHAFDDRVEMYLKTIWELSISTSPLPIAKLAEWLGISTVSATEMVHKLEQRKVLSHMPYKGIELTEAGNQQASAVVRRHKLWECFLYSKLTLPWDQVHDAACQLEHAADINVTESLAEFLDNPTHCPHGNPIPSAEGAMEVQQGIRMSELHLHQRATVTRIYPEIGLVLQHAVRHNLLPGRQILYEGSDPLDGPMHVVSEGKSHPIGRGVAEHFFVQIEDQG
jgi:DtxR family Mn-dependent transcriptional regulator